MKPKPGKAAKLRVLDEDRFAAAVRDAGLPLLVACFAAGCDASAALRGVLQRVGADYRDRLSFAEIDIARAELVAENFVVLSTPTLLAFHQGELVTRAVGFAPEGLTRRFCDEMAAGTVAPHWLWSPTEEVFEDEVILPLLQRWGWRGLRQAPCRGQAGRRSQRGRIDVLVYEGDDERPLTLFENKRMLLQDVDLRRAAAQAEGYARALDLPSCVVAAPAGAWVYALREEQAFLAGAFSALQLHNEPDALRRLLLRLGAAAAVAA